MTRFTPASARRLEHVERAGDVDVGKNSRGFSTLRRHASEGGLMED